MDIQFRNIKKQDIETIVQMSAQFGYEIRYGNFTERINELIKNSSHAIIVATNAENKAVGWIQLEMSSFIFSDKTCIILAVFVDKNFRGNQIGKKLIEKAEIWAKEKGCMSFKICSDLTRIDLQAFYKHMGFELVKSEQVFFKRFKKP